MTSPHAGGLDTNVLVRYLVEDDPDQAARARQYIEAPCTVDAPRYCADDLR